MTQSKFYELRRRIHDALIDIADATDDNLSSFVLQFRKSDLFQDFRHFAEAVSPLLQSEWCHRLPYHHQSHETQ